MTIIKSKSNLSHLTPYRLWENSGHSSSASYTQSKLQDDFLKLPLKRI